MSAAAAPSRPALQRRVPRCPLAVPVDVTALRSGVPDCIPGRLLDVGEGGVAVALAGELRRGDSVGVEFRLPNTSQSLHAKAVVRHQALLRCGLEFVGLSLEQEAMIRYWVGGSREKRSEIEAAAGSPLPETVEPETARMTPFVQDSPPIPSGRPVLRRLLWLAVAAFVVIGGLGWWQWYRVWQELESQVPATEAVVRRLHPEAPDEVPAGVMEKLLTYKIDPVNPNPARLGREQGVVQLHAVVGQDGNVVDLRPISGPQELAPAAMDAVKRWRYEPYRVNGKTVEVGTTVAVEFRRQP
jgi:TonB family protein